MAKKTTVGTLPHEIMMETWRKEGKVHREELSLKALKLDHRLQAREQHLDLDNVKALHAVVKDGLTLAPIIVFLIEGVLYVVNGFHRVAVHKKEGLPSILADVVEGTWQEAVEFATCCNMANHALTPKTHDKKKAFFMLCDNGWHNRSARDIGRHIGVGGSAVGRWRVEWCERNNQPLPNEVVTKNGRKKHVPGRCPSSRVANSGLLKVAMCFGGETRHIPGKTKEDVDSNFAVMRSQRASSLASLGSSTRVSHWLSSRGVWFDVQAGPEMWNIPGGVSRGFAITYVSEDLRETLAAKAAQHLVAAIGRVVLVAEYCGLTRKIVLVFEPVKGYETIVDLARRLGIEFMTLEQFVEAVKAEEDSDGEAAVPSEA